MTTRSAAVAISVSLLLSMGIFLAVFAFSVGPVGEFYFRPGQILYSWLPHKTAALIFGYEGQGPHHYLWALCTVAFWWIVFATMALAFRKIRLSRHTA